MCIGFSFQGLEDGRAHTWPMGKAQFLGLCYRLRAIVVFKTCQRARSHKSGLLKALAGLEPQVWSFESASKLRAISLVF